MAVAAASFSKLLRPRKGHSCWDTTAGPRAESRMLPPPRDAAQCYRQAMAYPLSTAQTHLGELVAEARRNHRPVTISEGGKPVAAVVNIEDLAELEDRAALAAHLTDKAAGRAGIGLDELDAALDRIDAEASS